MPKSSSRKGLPLDDEALEWTKEQWNEYTSSQSFIDTYVDGAEVNISTLIADIGPKKYLALMENGTYLVSFKDKVIHSKTRKGMEILGKALRRGELSIRKLSEADIIAGNKADDLIQDAITIAGEYLEPNADWDDDSYAAAMLWAPDQWRECIRYSNFRKHFVRGGVVQLPKLKKSGMPEELMNRMIDRALNLVRVENQVIDADTDEGVILLEKALAEGKVSLSRMIEAEVFTRQEAINLHQEAVHFAENNLHGSAQWAEDQRKVVIPWIPEQWDAFVDSVAFDEFVEEGFVNIPALKTVMGSDMVDLLLDKVHTLVEVDSRIVHSTTKEGRAHLLRAITNGKILLQTLVRAGFLHASEVEGKLEEARKIAKACFQKGARWDSLSERDAMKWSPDEWDAAINCINFAERFTKKGVVQKDAFTGLMSEALYGRMVQRSSYLVQLGTDVVDVRTREGRDVAEASLWEGNISVRMGLVLNLITRAQADELYEQAREVARRNIQKGKKWSKEDIELAKSWSPDQWQQALEATNFSIIFTDDGKVNRDRAVVAMTPELFDIMVERTHAFIRVGSTIYDGFTKKGYDTLNRMNLL
ncbi:hypothetical protein COU78_06375 [Candidatus Peregrinibacteria bacterium CG10_big_fil_rev_8_21_14_0_10_49_24]|nr:MAG: hypothetical protein COV83_03205 [Candidatus Peregrinibacteria bacterium CG11_big_fil_rev_8_21_14_0_20_49_14]PIR50476.1 MAG: hypothetical protein COU78_06375 [Candidatus Peregrinibacteria bacterium CG10_big_fil_rev_8_21_14_0_10_49_24]PJA68312.1 MAG: hypothetical protein CO157_00365 [Candidatus Peregrinibacteria bacterium CG_4_9_14_3_um_filter_49_12]